MGALRIDLGAGQQKEEGWTSVDISPDSGADIIHDLRDRPWPFGDDSVDEARCVHFLEHLTGVERMQFMDELYRVLKPGATCLVIVPYWSSMRSIQDPTHQWPPLCEASFLYFNKGWREQNKLSHYPISCDFDFGYSYYLNPNLSIRAEEYRTFAAGNYLNSITDLQVTLTKRTPDGSISP